MMKKAKKPVALVILDGMGHSPKLAHNAVSVAKTPNLNAWSKEFPQALLKASGPAVGLLPGDIGNSEVGHLAIGSGRIVQQSVSIIHEAIEDGTFGKNSVLIKNFETLKKSGGRLHLMGLLSDSSVHSHTKHLEALLKIARQHGIKKVFIHAFLDGRDTPPQSARQYLDALEKTIKKIGLGTIASLHGRFYAMDRNHNWERTEQSYRTLTQKQNTLFPGWQETLEHNYHEEITDEFIQPTQLDSESVIQSGDGIIFFNFRPDRARQLTATFVNPQFDHFSVEKIEPLFFITPTRYSSDLETTVLYERKPIANTLPDILHKHGKRMFAIAETEKYAHVTYFFSGGREQALPNETHVLVPSITTHNYVNLPEMSAQKITEAVLESLKHDPCDFYLINYANADMVGHSGNMAATVKAIEYLDTQVKKLYDQVVTKMNGTLLITADHGNAEMMFDEKTQQPHTAHTTNEVPFIAIKNDLRGSHKKLPLTQLTDIAPFILNLMGLEVPKEMKRPYDFGLKSLGTIE